MIYRGDICLAELNGKGHEQIGTRPVIVIQNNKGNKYSNTLTIIPLTTNIEKDLTTHVFIKPNEDNKLKKNSIAKVESITTIDKTSIRGWLGKVTDEEMKEIEEAMKLHCGV